MIGGELDPSATSPSSTKTVTSGFRRDLSATTTRVSRVDELYVCVLRYDKWRERCVTGEMGRGVQIEEKYLNEEERRLLKQGWSDYQFNEFASNRISVHRNLPDIRPKASAMLIPRKCANVQLIVAMFSHFNRCLAINESDVSVLPDTSIIVVFRNEAWSTLLRTLHSCMRTAPPHLVREFIFVDDFSDFRESFLQLQSLLLRIWKIRIDRIIVMHSYACIFSASGTTTRRVRDTIGQS